MCRVCIFVEDHYNDNNGAWTTFTFWDGEKLSSEGGMYSDLAYNAYSVDATDEQILEASKHAFDTAELKNGIYNKYSQDYDYKGCTVILQRSRTAQNKVPLVVTGDLDAYVDNYNQRHGRKIFVIGKSGEEVAVSVNCIKEITIGVKKLPIWYTSK